MTHRKRITSDEMQYLAAHHGIPIELAATHAVLTIGETRYLAEYDVLSEVAS